MADCCECGNELSGSINEGSFFDYLNFSRIILLSGFSLFSNISHISFPSSLLSWCTKFIFPHIFTVFIKLLYIINTQFSPFL
jgi:hypothetical protein